MGIESLGFTNSMEDEDNSYRSCGALSQLPNELLGEITLHLMQIVTAPIDPYCVPDEPYPYYDGWMVVCQVCRRWRQAALSTPRLWTTITLPCNSTWLKAIVKRSGRLPLTVIVDGIPLSEKKPLGKGLVRLIAARTKYFQINLDSHFSYEVLDALSSPGASAPLLEVLAIKLCIDYGFPDEPLPVISSGSLPNLRHLTFYCDSEDHPISSELPVLKQVLVPSLTSLTLSRLETRITASSLLEILATLPKLQHMVLGEVLSSSQSYDAPPRISSPGRLIHLPYIRSIKFEGDNGWRANEEDENFGKSEADVLQYLAIPSSAKISFAAAMDDLYGEPLGFICGVLCDAVAGRNTTTIGPPPPPVTHCYVTLSTPTTYTFECTIELYGVLGRTDGRKRGHTCVRRARPQHKSRILQARFRTDYYNFIDCVANILKLFSAVLSSVTTLCFEGHVEDPTHSDEEDQFMDEVWLSIHETMPGLQNIAVLGHSANFIKWIASDPVEVEPKAFIMPHLQSLEVDASEDGWKLYVFDAGDVSDDSDEDDAEFTEGLGGGLVAALRVWRNQFNDRRRLPQLTIATLKAGDVNKRDLDEIRESRVANKVQVRQVNPSTH